MLNVISLVDRDDMVNYLNVADISDYKIKNKKVDLNTEGGWLYSVEIYFKSHSRIVSCELDEEKLNNLKEGILKLKENDSNKTFFNLKINPDINKNIKRSEIKLTSDMISFYKIKYTLDVVDMLLLVYIKFQDEEDFQCIKLTEIEGERFIKNIVRRKICVY